MTKIEPVIEKSWEEILQNEFQSEYFKQLKPFLQEEKKKFNIYPAGCNIFNAFNLTPFDEVKVVIMGQDPYHGPGQAHGLCFSVPQGIKAPPSLMNIFKEIKADLGIEINSANLEKWAKQGVLLLNAVLTVREGQAGSHQNKGWENFTDSVIRTISDNKENVIFILWGRYAHSKETLINKNKHHILKAAHPSPLSAHNGFFGCRHFSKTNEILKSHGKTEIDWSLT